MNKKYTLVLNVEDDEELNRAIDDMIKPRIVAEVRGCIDKNLNEIIKAEMDRLNAPKRLDYAIGEEIRSLSTSTLFTSSYNVRADITYKASEILADKYANVIKDSVKNAVEKKLDGILPVDIIKTVVDSMCH